MSLFDRELPPPPSPQIFFRQAPFNVLPEDRLPDDDRDINVRSPEVFSSPNSPNADYDSSHMPMHLPATVMDRYRRGSLTSSDCTRRSIISAQDEHFTPVRNLAILKYQRRSIFSPRITSDNSNREESLGMGQCWPCSAVLWRGHEKLCIGSVFLAFCLIIIGGIVGMYFACMFGRLWSHFGGVCRTLVHENLLGLGRKIAVSISFRFFVGKYRKRQQSSSLASDGHFFRENV